MPIGGLVENLSYWQSPQGERLELFGEGGGQMLSARYDVPLLAQIPIDMEIRKASDAGMPIAVYGTPEQKKYYSEIVALLISKGKLKVSPTT